MQLELEDHRKCPLDLALAAPLRFRVETQRDGLSGDHDTQCRSAGGIPFEAEVKPNNHKYLLLMPQADKQDWCGANEATIFVNKKHFCSFFDKEEKMKIGLYLYLGRLKSYSD